MEPTHDDLRRKAALMELLSEVSREALEEVRLEQLLATVVRKLIERQPIAVASIMLLDASGERFESETVAGGLTLDFPVEEGGWPVSRGVSGRCVRTGEPQLVLDPASDPDYVPGNENVMSEYLTPIRFRGRILGVLNVESTETGTFSADACQIFDRVADQVAGAIHLARLNRSLEEANRELARLMRMDELTGLANRRRFDEALREEWRRAARSKSWISLAVADIDAFKQFNDTLGHPAGDACLEEVGRLVAAQARRAGELAARWGGEEFALLLPGAGPQEGSGMAERLRAAIERRAYSHPASSVAPVITVSVGVASLRADPAGDPRQLLHAADGALYEAKRTGRNRVVARRAGR